MITDLTINGIAVGDMATYDVELNDLDSEGYRSIVSGKLVRTRIRSDVVKINLTFNAIDTNRAKQLLDALSAETFNVSYYDMFSKSTQTKTMYAGPKKYGYVKVSDGRFTHMVQGFSVNLIEV